MTPKEVVMRRKEIESALDQATDEVERQQLRLQQLQRTCTHPKKRRISTMGELCDYCPDCEWQS